MPNVATHLLEQGERRNLFMIHWPGHLPAGSSDRIASTFSSGVTVLNAMGYPITKMGLGRSLLNTAPTLVEQYPDFDTRVSGWMDDFRSLWHFADSPRTMTIHPQRAKIAIGTQVFPLPTAFRLDADHKITSIAFDNPEQTVDQVVGPLDDKNLVWVDACKNMFQKMQKPVLYPEGWCLWRGQEGEVKLIEHMASYDLRAIGAQDQRVSARF
jgi:phosphoglycerol transferase